MKLWKSCHHCCCIKTANAHIKHSFVVVVIKMNQNKLVNQSQTIGDGTRETVKGPERGRDEAGRDADGGAAVSLLSAIDKDPESLPGT